MKSQENSTMLTQSVIRALSLLACFSDEHPELRVSDIQKALGLTQSNVSRLLNTMASMGYVEKDEATGYYRLGPFMITLGGIALNNYEIRKQALPELYELERKLEMDANLAILDKGTVLYLAHVDSYRSPRMYTYIGRRNPLSCTALGKAILAFSEPELMIELVEKEQLHYYTEHSVMTKEQLYRQLEEARKRGYSIESEETELGKSCMAAPIMGRSGKVIAGLSVSGFLSEMRLDERQEEIGRTLIELANRISMKMGHHAANQRRSSGTLL